MLKIDERFNIEKSVADCQWMRLELFNVYVNSIENVIIRIYNTSYEITQDVYKFYEDEGFIECFFLLKNVIPKGEYNYNVEVMLKENCKINVIDERSFIVHD